MLLEQYNQTLRMFDEQLKCLQTERAAFVSQHKEHIMQQLENRRKEQRNWFIKNFDVFWNNKEKFANNSPQADIVIDFFRIYFFGLKSVCFISIGDLLELWKMGFMYNNCPVVEFIAQRFEHRLSYIKNGKLFTINIYDRKKEFFSPLVYGVLEYMGSTKCGWDNFAVYKTIADMKKILEN